MYSNNKSRKGLIETNKIKLTHKVFVIFLWVFGNSCAFAQNTSIVNPDSLVPYRIGNKWGYSDRKGKIILTPKLDSVAFFYNNKAVIKDKNFFYLIDSNLKRITTKGYTDMRLMMECNDGIICYEVMDNDKNFYLDQNGKILSDPSNCGCQRVQGFEERDRLIKDTTIGNAEKKYFANDPERILYDDIDGPEYNKGFSGYFIVRNDTLYGLIHNNGNSIDGIFDIEYQWIDRYFTKNKERRFILKKDNMEALFSENGVIIPFKYKKVSLDYDRTDLIRVKTIGGKTGYINLSGFEYFRD